MTRRDMYYFGAIGDGHFLYDTSMIAVGQYSSKWPADMPWAHLDGTLLPLRAKQLQSHYVIHHAAGWTAMAFWDRTEDKRGNSNSAFIARGFFSAEQMVDLAKEKFPKIMKRLEGCEFKEWKHV